ncbi:MAG: glyoxylate/hydroxypyruvate reductase A, partial [Balneolaceae bacterium]|nr:glyoxylate/hydroxypyruvate reductase A [Balneolaceae bacterium]
MSLVLLAPDRAMQTWKESLLQVDPNLEVEIWPEISNPGKVHFVVAWNHPKQVLNSFPNLKAVSSLGAGVDHLVKDPSLPKGIPVCRVISESLVRQMKEYVLCAILNYQRNIYRYVNQKEKGVWESHPNKSPDDFTVGIMGL